MLEDVVFDPMETIHSHLRMTNHSEIGVINQHHYLRGPHIPPVACTMWGNQWKSWDRYDVTTKRIEYHRIIQCGAPGPPVYEIVKLVNITPISLRSMMLVTI